MSCPQFKQLFIWLYMLPALTVLTANALAQELDINYDKAGYSLHSEDIEIHINTINTYFNNRFSYYKESDDRWLQRHQFIAQGGGDCEDFALSKYQSLLESGINKADFRFVYALQIKTGEYHIALRHQPSNMLLDSLTSDTESIENREDLKELFQFTADAFYPSGISRLSRAQLKTLQGWQQSIKQAELSNR